MYFFLVFLQFVLFSVDTEIVIFDYVIATNRF